MRRDGGFHQLTWTISSKGRASQKGMYVRARVIWKMPVQQVCRSREKMSESNCNISALQLAQPVQFLACPTGRPGSDQTRPDRLALGASPLWAAGRRMLFATHSPSSVGLFFPCLALTGIQWRWVACELMARGWLLFLSLFAAAAAAAAAIAAVTVAGARNISLFDMYTDPGGRVHSSSLL